MPHSENKAGNQIDDAELRQPDLILEEPVSQSQPFIDLEPEATEEKKQDVKVSVAVRIRPPLPEISPAVALNIKDNRTSLHLEALTPLTSNLPLDVESDTEDVKTTFEVESLLWAALEEKGILDGG